MLLFEEVADLDLDVAALDGAGIVLSPPLAGGGSDVATVLNDHLDVGMDSSNRGHR